MGTDYLQLLDRRTTQVIVNATESDLAALVDMRSTFVGPPVWQTYWDEKQQVLVEFPFGTSPAQRLRMMLECGYSMDDVKHDLVHDFCVGGGLNLDYWGCWAEVFSAHDPPGSITWEEFIASIRDVSSEFSNEAQGASGRYLLSHEDVSTILRSLEGHFQELSIMAQCDLDRLRGWQVFTDKHPETCILYQMDF